MSDDAKVQADRMRESVKGCPFPRVTIEMNDGAALIERQAAELARLKAAVLRQDLLPGGMMKRPVDANEIFEAIGELYYAKFHRLRPGKSEPAASGRSSMDEDNLAQFDEWRRGEGIYAAAEKIVRLERRVALLDWIEESARNNADHAVVVEHLGDNNWSYLHGLRREG